MPFDVLTVDLDCWNCHFLIYSLAYCVNIKLTCSLLCKTASDTVSSVLQCKYARKVRDVVAQVSKIKKKENLEPSQNYWCQKDDMNHVPYVLEVPEA